MHNLHTTTNTGYYVGMLHLIKQQQQQIQTIQAIMSDSSYKAHHAVWVQIVFVAFWSPFLSNSSQIETKLCYILLLNLIS